MTDVDADGRPDLVFIKTKNTGSRMPDGTYAVEVHALSAARGFKGSAAGFAQVSGFRKFDADNGWFQVGGR